MPSTLHAKSTTYDVSEVQLRVGDIKHVAVKEVSTKGIQKRVLYSVKGDKVTWYTTIKGEFVYEGTMNGAVEAYNADYE